MDQPRAFITVNGRFLERAPTGVDRVAIEMLKALLSVQNEMSDQGSRLFDIIGPPNVKTSPDWLSEGRYASCGVLRGHAWEQCDLPLHLGQATWLYSPCNIGPVLRRRHIVTLHDAQAYLIPDAYTPAFRLWYKLIQPRLARQARLVTTVSNFSKAQLEHFGVVPPGKTKVIYNGADHILRVSPDRSVFERHQLIPTRYFLAVGSRSPNKNIAMLQRAAAALPAGSPPLVVAGGVNTRVLADAGLKAESGVRLLGRVSDSELKALYEGALAFAFPSLTEGFGIPPLEAMLCGCPVIASTGGAIPEICGDAALLVDPNDEPGWTAALRRMAHDADMRRHFIDAGDQRARLFTWRRSAIRFLLLLADADENHVLKNKLSAIA